jgi:hypothetical protein
MANAPLLGRDARRRTTDLPDSTSGIIFAKGAGRGERSTRSDLPVEAGQISCAAIRAACRDSILHSARARVRLNVLI